jgi:hypothetical protein
VIGMNNLHNATIGRSSLSPTRLRSLRAIATALAFTLIGAPLGACSGGSGGGTGQTTSSECTSDSDCKGTRVCDNGSCVDPNGAPDAGKHDSATSGSGTADSSPPPPACIATSHSCSDNGECCNYQSGTGYCTDFGSGGECADSCSSNSDCTSGCCAATSGGGSVCSPASQCQTTCHAAGYSCTVNNDCCDYRNGQGYCANFGGTTACHDSCSSNSDCTSGCCARLNNGAYVCAAANYCP